MENEKKKLAPKEKKAYISLSRFSTQVFIRTAILMCSCNIQTQMYRLREILTSLHMVTFEMFQSMTVL